jgi:hypothetical protein
MSLISDNILVQEDLRGVQVHLHPIARLHPLPSKEIMAVEMPRATLTAMGAAQGGARSEHYECYR